MGEITLAIRGYLPHWDAPGATQFLTWRLADSLPAATYEQLAEEHRDPVLKPKLWKRVEDFLDTGAGDCVLRNPTAANVFVEHLISGHGKLYVVHAFVVMPNHVHLLLTVGADVGLAELMRKLKGGTSHAINLALGRTGRLWQPDYFDRLIRSDEHFRRTVEYVHWKPG